MAKANNKHNSKLKPIKLVGNTKYQTIAAIIVIVAAAILGYFLFIASHASTPFVSIEAETGTLDSGNIATKITDSTASGGSAIQFGALPSTGGNGNQYCGFAPGTHPSKVMIIWEENEDSTSIIGGGQGNPFTNTLASECALATNYNANGHPSLPNYMATAAGNMSPYNGSPWTNDCNAGGSCSTGAASIFSQLGSNWKGYAESMSGNCSTSDQGEYAQRHNPAVYFTNIVSACQSQDVPLGTTSSGAFITDINNGTLPLLSTVTPNLINDGHDSNLATVDSWLSLWIPKIIAGSDYSSGKLAVLIAWDEGVNTNHTTVIGMSAGMAVNGTTGISDGTSYNNVSLTHTIDQITGQANLGQTATSMNAGFKF